MRLILGKCANLQSILRVRAYLSAQVRNVERNREAGPGGQHRQLVWGVVA
jgi:hypothetical protein